MNTTDMNTAMFLEMRKKKVNHILHLILTCCTMGLWLIVWIGVSMSASSFNANIESNISDPDYGRRQAERSKSHTKFTYWLLFIVVLLPILISALV